MKNEMIERRKASETAKLMTDETIFSLIHGLFEEK